MSINIDATYSTLCSMIQCYREKVSAVKPEDEWQENVINSLDALCSLQEFFSEIENTTLSCIKEVERYDIYPTSYERFEATYRMFGNFLWFESSQSDNARIDPHSFGGCLSLMYELIGKNETQTLCRAMNEIVILMLRSEP